MSYPIKFRGWANQELAVLEDIEAGIFEAPLGQLQSLSEQGLLGSYMTWENWKKYNPTQLVSTSTTTPLISSGIADKLKEAGFSDNMVDPLTKANWTNAQVEEFLDGQESITEMIAPRNVNPKSLIITPAAGDSDQNSFLQKLPYGILGLGAAGLILALALKD